MFNSPVILLALLLFGLGLSYLIAARWPARTSFASLIVTGISLIIWFLLRAGLPFTPSLEDEPVPSIPVAWKWVGNESIWLLSGVLLLLLFSLLLYRVGHENNSSQTSSLFNWRLHSSQWQPLLILALAASGLAVIWAATLATLMTFWTLFVLIWALYLWATGARLSMVTQSMVWLFIPLLFAGLAAALKPAGSDLSNLGTWSQPAIIAILLTAMSELGIIPFTGWRSRSESCDAADGALLVLLPSLLGTGLLIRLVEASSIAPGAILILTIFALITILSGARRAWAGLRSAVHFPTGMALSLSGLAFLIGIWTHANALLASVQLLVFAVVILFFLEKHPISRIFWWRAVSPVLVLFAMAAVPFTAGFIALNTLYTFWFDSGFWILAIALILLMLPLLAAALIFVRDHIDRQPANSSLRPSPFIEIAQLLPATGLIMVSQMNWHNTHWATWLALLATTAGALLLARFVGEAQEVINSIEEALSAEKLSFAQWRPGLQKFADQVLFSFGEAAFILEGDWGLLWLSTFLTILLFAVSG
jgi:hypothetical protein